MDHINGNPMDNRRSNLRICTHYQNLHNRPKQKNNTVGYKGVWCNIGKKRISYYATIWINNKKKHIGTYYTAEEAAKAYNDYSTAMLGEYSYGKQMEAL